MKYLDLTGLGEVWANIKSYISSKIPTKTSQLQNDSSYATTSQLPSKTSQLTNDSGFLTSTNISNKADKATTLSGYGITDAYTKTQVDKKVSDLVNSAPETLDTLNELASALGNDPNFATTVATQIGTKANDANVVHKNGNESISGVKNFNNVVLGEQDGVIRIGNNIQGAFFCTLAYDGQIYNNLKQFVPKTNNEYNLGTSTNKWANVYATTFRGNLEGSVAWANVSGKPTIPTKTSELANDSGFLTSGNVVTTNTDQTISGIKTFNNNLWAKNDICLRIQNIDNNETNPPREIGSSAIGFTNKDASAWWAYNRYIRTTADGIAYLNLLCHPIKKSDGNYTSGGYINIYNTGFARVNDPLKVDPNLTWNNNNIVTANWVKKLFSNSIGNYWSKSAIGNQYSHSTFSYLSTIDKATTNISWSQYKPFRIVDKDNSIELGYVGCGYKSDLAYTRLFTSHNNGGWCDFTIHSNGVAYLDNCSELWLVNKKLNSYNTTPSYEVDTQFWFMDKNSNKYATLQTDYFPNGIRQFALTHRSLRTNSWIGLNIKTSPTDDVIVCQPRFQAQDQIVVHNTDSNRFTQIHQGWVEMSAPDYCCIDLKHEGSQDYLGRIGLNPTNILYLETINGAPIMANGKNIVRSINGVNADNNGNVNIQGFSNGIGEIIQGYYVPNGIVQKSGSVYFGTLVQPNVGATLSDFRDINITITNEFHPEAGKIYDYSQIFSTLYLHSYDSDYAVGATFDCGSSPKVDKWFGGWIKVAGSNLVRNSGKYLCTSVSSYGYAVTLRYNLTMTCEKHSYPGGSSPSYRCKIVSKTVPQNQMTVTAKATFMRVG